MLGNRVLFIVELDDNLNLFCCLSKKSVDVTLVPWD